MLPPIDFDGPWKEALDLYLEEALVFFFPEAHAAIDWSRGYQPLDKELQQLAPEEPSGVQAVDKLVQVWLREDRAESGDTEIWVLVHLEVQSQRDTLFAERMFRYHARLYDQYRRRVASFAGAPTEGGSRGRATGLAAGHLHLRPPGDDAHPALLRRQAARLRCRYT